MSRCDGQPRTRSACFAALALALASTVLFPAWAQEIDRDGDGLDDALEDVLLDRYRPILTYDQQEIRWPCSVTDFVSACDLYYVGVPEIGTVQVYSQQQLAADPFLALRGNDFFRRGESSSWGYSSQGSHWRLGQANPSANFGVFPGAGGANHRGMYGHVMPMGDGRILIQYWQFFPFNDARFMNNAQDDCDDGGNHEGDWTWIDVLVLDNAPSYPLSAIWYHHHGDRRCAPIMVPCPEGIYREAPQGVRLPADGVPRVFVEAGNHELWPWPSNGGECSFCGGWGPFEVCVDVAAHRSGPVAYRVPWVPNVGEVFSPMPDSMDAELMLLFNGTWGKYAYDCEPFDSGTPADPVPAQSSRNLGPADVDRPAFPIPRFVRYVDAAFAGPEHGTPRFPDRSLATASHEVAGHGKIIVRPGSYGEPVTISTPMTIEPWR